MIQINRQLRFSTRYRSTIFNVLLERGYEHAGDSQDFDFAWLTKEEISPTYTQLQSQSRYFYVNHYLTHQQLSRKDLLAHNVQNMFKQLLKQQNNKLCYQFKTIPQTYVLPEDFAAFVRDTNPTQQMQQKPLSVLKQLQSNKPQNLPSGNNIKTSIASMKYPKSQLIKSNMTTPDKNQQVSSQKQDQLWIVKPACLLQGQGIFIATSLQVQQWYKTDYKEIVKSAAVYDEKVQQNIYNQYQKKNIDIPLSQIQNNYKSGYDLYLIQKYMDNPLLINGHKFDCRVYVLVTQFQPNLVCYICTEGFARFALQKYQKTIDIQQNINVNDQVQSFSSSAQSSVYESSQNSDCETSLSDDQLSTTTQSESLAKRSKIKSTVSKQKSPTGRAYSNKTQSRENQSAGLQYITAAHLTNVAIQKNQDAYDNSDGGDGAKMSIFNLCQTIQLMHGRKKALKCRYDVETCILRTLQAVSQKMAARKGAFEIYGFDVMIDDQLNPCLCEVNACPSLSADTTEDKILKKRMLNDALSIIIDGKEQQTVGTFRLLYDGPIDFNNFDLARKPCNAFGAQNTRVLYQ